MDDLDSLLEDGHTHTRRTLLLLGLVTGAALILSGLYLLPRSNLSLSPAPLPPFHPDLKTATASSVVNSEKINLNTADKEAILSLPNIGEVRANQIIEHRPYASISELQIKAKLPSSVTEKLKEYVSF